MPADARAAEPDLARSLVDGARALLDRAGLGADRTGWRWTIRTDAFDALRDRLEQRGALHLPMDREPTFLGIPYDLGWPPHPALITLAFAPVLAWPLPRE